MLFWFSLFCKKKKKKKKLQKKCVCALHLLVQYDYAFNYVCLALKLGTLQYTT